MKIVAIVTMIVCGLIGYSCCVVSGECSRMEEKMMQERNINDDSED